MFGNWYCNMLLDDLIENLKEIKLKHGNLPLKKDFKFSVYDVDLKFRVIEKCAINNMSLDGKSYLIIEEIQE